MQRHRVVSPRHDRHTASKPVAWHDAMSMVGRRRLLIDERRGPPDRGSTHGRCADSADAAHLFGPSM